MGIDIGAVLFYGFSLSKDHNSVAYEDGKEIYQYQEELYNKANQHHGVQIGNSDTLGDPKYFIYANNSVTYYHGCEYAEVTKITTDPNVLLDWEEKLYRYCLTHGFDIQQPKWYLTATIS